MKGVRGEIDPVDSSIEGKRSREGSFLWHIDRRVSTDVQIAISVGIRFPAEEATIENIWIIEDSLEKQA